MQSIRPSSRGWPLTMRQHDDAEVHLQLRVLVQIVQDDFGLLAALQLDDDAHAVAVAFVANVADALDLLFVDKLGDVGDEPGLVHLIRNLGNDEGFAVPCRCPPSRPGARIFSVPRPRVK